MLFGHLSKWKKNSSALRATRRPPSTLRQDDGQGQLLQTPVLKQIMPMSNNNTRRLKTSTGQLFEFHYEED